MLMGLFPVTGCSDVTVKDNNLLGYQAVSEKEYDAALQFFDALIIAGAERANCDTVYSEDMTDGERYGNVTVVNPFKAITP